MIKFLGHEIEWLPKVDKNQKALYIQISESIEKDIKSGKLPTGFKLPPQRLIADYLKINHSTVTKAYKHCEDKGLIHGITGKGTCVSNTLGTPKTLFSSSSEHFIDMTMLHPLYETNYVLVEMVKELFPYFDTELLYKYTSASGHQKHKFIAAKWLETLNIYCNSERMLITSGAQNALFTILLTEFTKGDSIAVDELTYTGLRNSANQLGLNLIPIEGDEEGMKVERLGAAIRKHNIKGIYVIPDCHNPTTVVMGINRRKSLANLIEKYKLIVIEDSVFRFASDINIPTIHSLIPEYCYHIASMSKLLNPGFRIAYLLIPSFSDYEKIEYVLHNQLFMPSSITNEIVSCLQSSKKINELLKIRVNIMNNRNDIFNKIFGTQLCNVNVSPLYRFLDLDGYIIKNIDLENFFKERGIMIYSADRFRVKEGIGKRGIRISIASDESKLDFIEQLNSIYKVYNELLSMVK